ncbi:MAG TPA: type I methionyl aminopeptidase [Candidatus Limnocylindrales bacterium]|nr:type I methionyl aminopeptidase [Candidatus Limnocylindrales bacterium]
MITRKSRAEIEHMRTAGRVVAEVLALLEEQLRPGITTAELDRLAERHIRAAGMTPSFRDYIGNARYDPKHPHAYPATLCISIDDEVVHGIPGRRPIRDGQLVSIDVGAIHRGWHADAARTFIVGDVPEDVRRLVAATRRALDAGIAAARPGNRVGDIGGAVEDVATEGGYGIVRTFVGHGIGTDMHQDPQVPNFRSPARGVQLQPGMCLAIEPMLTLGGDDVHVLEDGWTVATVDGALAAHFEDTVAVTENGPDILTRFEG